MVSSKFKYAVSIYDIDLKHNPDCGIAKYKYSVIDGFHIRYWQYPGELSDWLDAIPPNRVRYAKNKHGAEQFEFTNKALYTAFLLRWT